MTDIYDGFSDEELIDRYRDGDSNVMDYLVNKYKGLVRNRAKDMFILGGDNDDLLQEGMIGLFKAVQNYDSGRDASFLTFAGLCISRQIYTAVQASGRQKHAPLNSYISMYARTENDVDGKERDILDNVPSKAPRERNPEEMLIDRENEKELIVSLEAELSEFERQVLDLCLTGMNYTEIARILGREEKAADNAIQRIRSKMKKIVKDKRNDR